MKTTNWLSSEYPAACGGVLYFNITPDLGSLTKSVKIKATGIQATTSTTLNYAPLDLSLTTATATLGNLVTTSTLSPKIDNGYFNISYKVSYDGGSSYKDITTTTSDQIFTTLATPTGFASYIRLNYWCSHATGMTTGADIADVIGPDAVGRGRFASDHSIYGEGSQHVATAWVAMDGTLCDCITLSTLMKQSLDLLGVTGSETRYVWPKHANWTNLWDTTGTHQETLVTASRNTVLGFDSGGWNNYEGCCFYNNKWWMGGLGESETTPLAVLQDCTLPNNVDDGPSTPTFTATQKQCYFDDQSIHASYPTGTP